MALTFKRRSAGLHVIPVFQLGVGRLVTTTLYHETATPLIKQGERITATHLRALAAAGIKDVYECKTEDDLLNLVNATPKRPIPLAAVPVGSPIPYNIYDGNDRFLLRKEGVLAQNQYEHMVEANVENVFINEEKLLQMLNAFDLEMTKCQAETIEEEFQKDEELRVSCGDSVLPSLLDARPLAPRPPVDVENALRRYKQHVLASADLLTTLRQGKAVEASVVNGILNGLMEDLSRDLDLTIGFANTLKDGGFAYHSVNVTALSVGVGLALGYKESELRDLGQAALLHEAGMLSVPKEILEKKTALEPQERQRITDHPIQALNYLGRVNLLPHSIVIAVYQEHECLDRSGYPNQRPGSLIHDFAQIIGICDVFEAMTSPRAFRQPMVPYRVLEQLVFQTAKLRYNHDKLRALLQLTGLFPIGSWIKLSNNCVARIIGNNYERYDRPIVSVLYDDKGQQLEQIKSLDMLQEEKLQITDIEDGAKFQVPGTFGF